MILSLLTRFSSTNIFCYFCYIFCYFCHVSGSTKIFCYFCYILGYFCHVFCSTKFFCWHLEMVFSKQKQLLIDRPRVIVKKSITTLLLWKVKHLCMERVVPAAQCVRNVDLEVEASNFKHVIHCLYLAIYACQTLKQYFQTSKWLHFQSSEAQSRRIKTTSLKTPRKLIFRRFQSKNDANIEFSRIFEDWVRLE